MNNTLTKTLTAGLMHGLKIQEIRKGSFTNTPDIIEITTVRTTNISSFIREGKKLPYRVKSQKPYLLPMSSLTKEIEFKGERFVPMQALFGSVTFWKNYIDKPLSEWEHSKVDWLIEHHFNVFNLSPEEYIEVNETNNPYL